MDSIITLTTDFGLEDAYAGIMKGVILGRAPTAKIVDLTHLIPPQDIKRAALLIKSAGPNFPPATIHLIVVDPGVGSDRKIILLKNNDQLFLAPNNGVLTFLFNEQSQAYEVADKNLFPDKISKTFHGRDIFAPVAAALANGLNPADVGPEIAFNQLIKFSWPKIKISKNEVKGKVVYIDHFGNLVTNIYFNLLSGILQQNPNGLNVKINGKLIEKISSCYREGKEAQLIALFNSDNYLEISLVNGNAASEVSGNVDDEVKLYPAK